jgi:CHAT domain-containing protein/Tfp pilus assembly protein PilF
MKNLFILVLLLVSVKSFNSQSFNTGGVLSGDIFFRGISSDDTLSDKYWHRLGINAGKQGDFENAGYYLNKSILRNKKVNGKDSISLANTFMDMGVLNKKAGKPDDALSFYDKAMELYKSKHGQQYVKLGFIYTNKGNIYGENLNFEKAIVHYEKALTIFKKNKKFKLVAKIFNNLGLIFYEYQQYKKAEAYFQKSIAIKKEANLSSLFNIYGNMARTYNKLNDSEKAEKYYNLAIKNIVKEFGNKHSELAHTYLNYGIFCKENDKSEKADFLFNKALNNFINNLGLKHSYTSNCLLCIGNFYFEEGKIEKSLFYYQKALSSICENFNNDSYKENPALEESIGDIQMLKTLSRKGKALLTYYNTDEGNDIQNLIISNETFALAVKLLHKMRKSFRNIKSKLFLLKLEKHIFYFAAKSAADLYRKTGDEKYKELVFSYSEQSKSSVLSSMVSDFEAKEFGNIPEELRESEKELRRKTELYKSRIYSEKQKKNPDKQKISKNEEKLFDITNNLDNLIDTLEGNYKAYYDLKYDNSVININDLREKMNSSEVLIEYMLPEADNDLCEGSMLTIIISKDIFEIHTVSVDSTFDNHIATVRNSLNPKIFETDSRKAFSAYVASAYKLYEKLLKPYENIIKDKKIIIIPDKKLSYIPFDVLLTKMPENEEPDYRNLPYLIRKRAISYSYSANLRYHSYFRHTASDKNLLAFAPSYKNIDENNTNMENRMFLRTHRDQLIEIKGIEEEVKNISEITGGDVYTNLEATESAFKNSVDDYSIMHLAMHAIVNNDEPMYSKLVFTQVKDNVNDGFLNTYELYNMRLNSQLVVLSACSTGDGVFNNGEGVMSLARGFRYAGVQSIIMTLWQIEDKSSSELMTLFYSYLSQGMPKDKALQLAKLNFLNKADPFKAHPYFWTGYVGIGDTCPILKKSNNSYFLYVLFFIFIGGLIIYIKMKKLRLGN